jgi:hypothetical protein
MAKPNTLHHNTFEEWRVNTNLTNDNVGDLVLLTTPQPSLVDAINALEVDVSTAVNDFGVLTLTVNNHTVSIAGLTNTVNTHSAQIASLQAFDVTIDNRVTALENNDNAIVYAIALG